MFYFVAPEVAGGLGPGSILDNNSFPPIVSVLEYRFDGWLGDDLLEVFPCFIVTRPLKEALAKSSLTGFQFANVLVSKSDTFDELYPGRNLPDFSWLQVKGKARLDDIGITEDGRLVLSSQTMKLLTNFNLHNAEISETP